MQLVTSLLLCSLSALVTLPVPQVIAATEIYQAEEAALHLTYESNVNSGYTGEGYADFDRIGSYAEWTVEAAESGDYEVSIRYSAKVSRPCVLIVDGITNPIRQLEFRSTNSWSVWSVETLSVYLSQGIHTLKVLAQTSTGPNIDWLSLTSSTHERLEANDLLFQGQFISSPNGRYSFGISSTGGILLRDSGMINPLWSAGIPGASFGKMQGDGNFVVRDSVGNVIWDTDTYMNDGATLFVTNEGRAVIERFGQEIWSVGLGSATTAPIAPSPSPPMSLPTPSPIMNTPTNGMAVALSPDKSLLRGQFVNSPRNNYRTGLTNDGEFVFQTISGATIWSAGVVNDFGVGVASQLYMQSDGNLVVRAMDGDVKWDSNTYMNNGAELVIYDDGVLGIQREGSILWSVGTGTPNPPSTGAPATRAPATSNTLTSAPVATNYAISIVLEPGNSLGKGQFYYAPGNGYKVGLTNAGEFEMQTSSGRRVWSAGIIETYGGARVGDRCYMQDDGNLIVRDSSLRALWTTHTSNNFGAYLGIDDGGQVRIMHGVTAIWSQGIPRGTYTGPSSQDLQFPIRGSFYYPWYPETWTVNNAVARFEPTLGFYSSADPLVVEEHIDMLDYAYVDLNIASWWGPDTNLDKARLTLLMDKTLEAGSNMKWTIYHEEEFHADPSAASLREDLDYLKTWFAWHPTWAHIDGRPVIFVYNEVGCEVVNRWMAASNGEWYVVLKLFRGFRECAVQPDSWHQYGPADAVVQIAGHSFGVSPGFWRADIAQPLLNRVSQSQFCANVNLMVQSGEPWQLITTFNEAGEGTMVEPSRHWASSSGYGFYLDCLHTYH